MQEYYMSDYTRALCRAIIAHDKQYDESGLPYVIHLIAASELLDTNEGKIAAILHDIINMNHDNDLLNINLIEKDFDENIASIVDCLTKQERETYEQYMHRVCKNEIAIKIIIAKLKIKINKTLYDEDIIVKLEDKFNEWNKWINILEKCLEKYNKK